MQGVVAWRGSSTTALGGDNRVGGDNFHAVGAAELRGRGLSAGLLAVVQAGGPGARLSTGRAGVSPTIT